MSVKSSYSTQSHTDFKWEGHSRAFDKKHGSTVLPVQHHLILNGSEPKANLLRRVDDVIVAKKDQLHITVSAGIMDRCPDTVATNIKIQLLPNLPN